MKAKDRPKRTSCLECEYREWQYGKKLKCTKTGEEMGMTFGGSGFETLQKMCADFKGVNVRAVQNNYFRELND